MRQIIGNRKKRYRPMLTFEEKDHVYRWDNSVVPSVTQILKPLINFDHIQPDVLDIARQRGVAVHRMIELDCKGDLDEDGLPDWMRPALVNWRKFVAESGFQLIESEYRVFHPHYKYAGTLDLFGRMDECSAFIDVKRSFAAGPVIGLQLAAYHEAYCAQEKVGKAAKRYALKLSEKGPYRLEPYTDKADFGVFLSLLTIHQWKGRHKC